MHPDPSDRDAALFDMVHSLLREQQPETERERRGGRRRSFNCAQLLAPYDGRQLPAQADFRLERCLEISPTGFSFVTSVPPRTTFVVIALGAVPFKFFSARVMHVGAADETDAGEFRVGCKLLQRIAG
jgi:hypothetical protein